MKEHKQEILESSLEYFLRHGIREMPNERLASLLGISTKTLYRHFRNKEHLVEEAVILFHTGQYKMLENLSPGGNAVCLFFDLWFGGVEIEYRVNKAFFKDLHHYYPAVAIKVESAISRKFREQFLMIIRRATEEGDFSPDIIPEVALDGIFILYTTLVRSSHFEDYSLSTMDAMLNTIAIYIRGLCTPKGLELLDNHITEFRKKRDKQ